MITLAVSGQDVRREGPPKPLLGKHVYELRVASERLDLTKARGMLRLEPAQGTPILLSLHYENPAVPEMPPADASTRTLPLGSDGPTATLLIFRPSTEFTPASGRKTPPAPATAGRGYFFVDLLFDRPDAQFRALLTLDVDGRVHSAEFDYPWADARREAK